jgi:hypothetical protein
MAFVIGVESGGPAVYDWNRKNGANRDEDEPEVKEASEPG